MRFVPVTVAALALMVVPLAAADAAPRSDRGTERSARSTAPAPTENDDGDGVANTPDPEGDTDNRHPSGRDRHAEAGRSGDQGRTQATPDQDGRGPERDVNGTDQPGSSGGADILDQDRNNGCGNDDDFDDDSEGRCLGPVGRAGPGPTPPAPPGATGPGTPPVTPPGPPALPPGPPFVPPPVAPGVTPPGVTPPIVTPPGAEVGAGGVTPPGATVGGIQVTRAAGAQVLGVRFVRPAAGARAEVAALALTGAPLRGILASGALVLMLGALVLRLTDRFEGSERTVAATLRSTPRGF